MTPALRLRHTDMCALRRVGVPVPVIARRYGISAGHARKLLAGVHSHVPQRKPAKEPGKTAQEAALRAARWLERTARRQEALRLRSLGYSTWQIAERTGLSQRHVWRITRRVLIRELQGRARLPERQGRPAMWRDTLAAAAEGRACLL